MDTILYQGPGYTIARTDEQSTMTHYPGMTSEEQIETGWMRGPFIDLSESPELIDSIPELAKSPGLRSMISAVAGPTAKLMTIGCDVAEFPGNQEDDSRLHVGSYVNYAFRDIAKASDVQKNVDLACWILNAIGPPPDGIVISYEFIIEPLKSFYGHAGCYAVMAKAIGFGPTLAAAWNSYEWAADQMARSVAR
jgi:hypothetical protein